jgi:hypothetical protein
MAIIVYSGLKDLHVSALDGQSYRTKGFAPLIIAQCGKASLLVQVAMHGKPQRRPLSFSSRFLPLRTSALVKLFFRAECGKLIISAWLRES